MSDKIKISWDDLKSDSVDKKVKQQEMHDRARVHQEQVLRNAPPLPGGMPPPISGAMPMSTTGTAGGSIWMKSVVYLALFGLLGGLLAWGSGEAANSIGKKEEQQREEYNQFIACVKDGLFSSNRVEEIIDEKASTNPYFRPLRDSHTRAQFESAYKEINESLSDIMAIRQAFFYGSVGLLLAMCLAMAESVVSRNWNAAIVNGFLGGVIGAVGGVILSLFIDKIYAFLGGGNNESMATQMFARTVGWGIIGLFLAIAPGILMRSGKKLLTGLLGGLAGGLLGGLLFDPIGMLTSSGVISRLVGIVGIGMLSGVGIGMLENAFKSGWLKVLVGPIKGKQFIIYRNPTRIGSSPQSEIYLFKDPTISPMHAAITLSGGKFIIEHIGTGNTYVNGAPITKKKLAIGDEISIGNTRMLFEGKT